MAEQRHSNGVAGPIIAAILAAGGSSGITLYMSPGFRLANEPMARPDAYTGSMHNQYSETVDARFDAVYRSLTDQARRINEMREEHKMMREEQASYYRDVLDSMGKIHHTLLDKGK